MRNIAIAAALLLATAPVSAAAAAELDVVASFSILGDMVQRIGGDRVAVTITAGPDADTHVYEPKPGDAAALAGEEVLPAHLNAAAKRRHHAEARDNHASHGVLRHGPAIGGSSGFKL